MQLEAPLQRRNVTLHTAERRRRHPADGNYAGVSLACLSSCLSARVSVCLTQSVRFGFLQEQVTLQRRPQLFKRGA